MTHSHPDHIGTYFVGQTPHFYAVRRAELDRTGLQMARWLRSFNLPAGSYVLTISQQEEIAQFAPFEFAVQILALFGTNADDSPYDAGRVESLVRQFSPAAICGVSAATLEGLKMMGHDPQAVFAGRIVWARPDAFAAVDAMDGVQVRRVCTIGPALALECAEGGLHIDGREWALSDQDGTLALSSRMARVEPLSDLDTGVMARLDMTPCRCGSADPKIAIIG